MTGGVVRRDGLRELRARVEAINAKCISDLGDLSGIDWPQCLAPMVNVYSEAMNAIADALDAVSDVPPTEACVCGEPNTLGVVHREDGPCYLPVVPPDPPAVDRDELIRVLSSADPNPKYAAEQADALLSSGVLVAAADVRARALEDAADALFESALASPPEDWIATIARWLRDRAVSERERNGE